MTFGQQALVLLVTSDLQQLLRESSESRMAVSTRSVNIAVEAGSIVNFGARDPLGPVSVAIFMHMP